MRRLLNDPLFLKTPKGVGTDRARQGTGGADRRYFSRGCEASSPPLNLSSRRAHAAASQLARPMASRCSCAAA
ncbi:hypothetical protein F2981_19535 (plasmid) [Sinorhizobium meliloti]|nr:hypothetical protein [Sinorhizobium meliloti]